MAQTSYPATLAVAFEGLLGDGGNDAHIRTYTDDTNSTLFGRAWIQGATEDEGQVPNGADGTFLGVTVHTHSVEASEVPLATEAIPATQPVSVLSKGRIYVFPETAISMGDPVYYRHSNAGADPEGVGRFRNDNDGASGDVSQLTSGARWLTEGSAGDPVLLEISLP